MEYTLTNSNLGDISAEQLYNYSEKANHNLLLRFFEWCSKQQDNRFLWLGVAFFVQLGTM